MREDFAQGLLDLEADGSALLGYRLRSSGGSCLAVALVVGEIVKLASGAVASKKSSSAPASRVNAAMQASHQGHRYDANAAWLESWLESRQQFDEGAPALDLLFSGDVPAHGARIGIC